jgi:hypothetical protein
MGNGASDIVRLGNVQSRPAAMGQQAFLSFVWQFFLFVFARQLEVGNSQLEQHGKSFISIGADGLVLRRAAKARRERIGIHGVNALRLPAFI